MSAAPALWAAGVRRSYDLPSRPPAQAALAVGLQAGITVGVSVPCHGVQVAIRGRMDVHTAIDLALAGSDCRAVWMEGQTVRIERRPQPAQAAAPKPPPATPPEANLAEVVVTASKRGVDVFHLPGSVSVVQAQALAAVRVRDTADLRLLASGMTVTNLGAGRDKVLLRGLSDGAFTGHTQSTVGLYWNQTPTTYNAPDPDLRLVDVQSVEVLRGPQGTLYGAGAIGGVVSVTPVAPDLSAASGFASATGATTAGGDPSAGAEAMFNLPLAGGKAALRLVAYGEEDGGYIDLPRLGVQNADHTQETGVRAAFRTEPSAEWSVTLGDIYQDIYSDDTQYTTGDPQGLERNTRVREPHDNDFEQAYLDIGGRGGWGELHSIGSFINHEFDSRYDATDAAADFGGASVPTAFDDDTLVRLTSQELDYRAPLHGPASLLVGGYGSYGDEHETTRLGPTGGGKTLYAEDRTDRMVDLALFGEASYALTSRLTATLGLRLAYAERRTLSLVDEAGAQAPFSGRYVTKEWSPKLALDYALVQGVRLYALASKGYRVGGFNTAGPLTTAFTAQGGAEPNRTYLPDDLWNYEAGVKLQGWRGRLQARTALYYDVWDRLQADQLLPSGLSYVANVGDAHVKGWEWEASVRPLQPLIFEIGALFTAPDLHKVDPSFPAGQSDFTLPGVARRSINSRIEYDVSLSGGRTLELDAAALYVGHSYLFFGPQGSSEMGHYLDGRLQGVFRTPDYSVGLLISNPANNRGDTFAFGNPFSLGAGPQSTPLRPRTVRLTLTHGF
ncbi:TonB-dependent receptor [Caulobacter sp. S45]|uniref:TonB-dependent receptor n=1 Tax=Caulobacter sp. S45 TaxID=1641861 RepID=UPI00157708FA|nr:TonB-dependent receptor [Caulobacter sp. S45]